MNGYIAVFYLLIENSYTRDCARDPFSTRISTHRAPRLNLIWHNETVLFYAVLDIFFLFIQRDYGKFILKQLDYEPKFSTSDSEIGCASLTIFS